MGRTIKNYYGSYTITYDEWREMAKRWDDRFPKFPKPNYPLENIFSREETEEDIRELKRLAIL